MFRKLDPSFLVLLLSLQSTLAPAGEFFGRVQVRDEIVPVQLENPLSDRYVRIPPFPPLAQAAIEKTGFPLKEAEILVPFPPQKINAYLFGV